MKKELSEGKNISGREEADYIYILVREDLTLAQQGVQSAHAGMLAVSKYGGLREDTRLIILKVKDQSHLLEYDKLTESIGLKTAKFWEPDHKTGWSALSTSPMSREKGKIFRKLPLWRPH